MPSFPTYGPDLVTSDRLPVLPLRDVVVFQYVVMPLLVGRAASLAALEAGNEEDRLLLLASASSRACVSSRASAPARCAC